MDAGTFSSGKGHRDENFPVASLLIRKIHRPVILAFYRFARAADDVADHPAAEPNEKLKILECMWRSIQGESATSSEAIALRRYLLERGVTPRHALDLLEAFRRDVTKRRYNNWGELMDYCRHSAAPVGRFVLDVHGESHSTWPASDALCTALQVINHLQDCGNDYRALDRVYLPLDLLTEIGAEVTDLAAPIATPPLREAISRLAKRTQELLARSRGFA
ncbi:MAG TPA: squalene/phytoene synthase family protein, partial [Rhizomicrobium sp.]|nr:squalene/phytoene synthase family protein [Rhizomicrobium sp.]